MKIFNYAAPSAYLSKGNPVGFGDYVLYKCLDSFKAYVRADDYVIGGHLAYDGFWEPHLTMAFINFAINNLEQLPNLVFADLGANSGYYSMIAGHLGFGEVRAYEADHRNCNLLRTNSKMCGRPFTVHECVLGSGGMWATPKPDPYSSNTSYTWGDKGAIPPTPVPFANVYKIDLEGGDEEVINTIMERMISDLYIPHIIFWEYAPQRWANPPHQVLEQFNVYLTGGSGTPLERLPLEEKDLTLVPIY